MPFKRLIFTRHAEDMAEERRIQKSWIEATVNSPDILEADTIRPGTMRAFRKIPERNRTLRVVYRAEGDDVWIITAFFDRGRR
jgi:hypothetical protein